MSRLEDLSNDKVSIMMKLIENQNICKALEYDSPDFLDQPNITDTTSLIYNKIYPYRFIPNVKEDASSFITLSFRNYKPINSSYKSGLIYIYVLTHINLIRTNYGWLRYDYILSEIDGMLNNSRTVGIGKMEFYDMDEVFINENYMGNFIAYKLYEFN